MWLPPLITSASWVAGGLPGSGAYAGSYGVVCGTMEHVIGAFIDVCNDRCHLFSWSENADVQLGHSATPPACQIRLA